MICLNCKVLLDFNFLTLKILLCFWHETHLATLIFPVLYFRPSNNEASNPWSMGGKDSLPPVASHLSNRDHLEAIHNHLRYIYDRLDDLLDRIHAIESRQMMG